MVFILFFRHLRWIFFAYNKNTLCGIVRRLNDHRSCTGRKDQEHFFFLFLIFHPKLLFLILIHIWSSVDFSLIIFTNIETRYLLKCSNHYVSKTGCVLRWFISFLTANLMRDDEDKKTCKRRMMVWLSYKILEELSQTPLGTKYSGFILKEKTLKLAKPVLYILKVSSFCQWTAGKNW